MYKAFVLLKVEAPPNVAKGVLSRAQGVEKVSMVEREGNAGFNAVVLISAEEMEELKESVRKIRRLSFVMSSCTLILSNKL